MCIGYGFCKSKTQTLVAPHCVFGRHATGPPSTCTFCTYIICVFNNLMQKSRHMHYTIACSGTCIFDYAIYSKTRQMTFEATGSKSHVTMFWGLSGSLTLHLDVLLEIMHMLVARIPFPAAPLTAFKHAAASDRNAECSSSNLVVGALCDTEWVRVL